MEELPSLEEDPKFYLKIAAVAAGVAMVLHSCLPQDRNPTDEQRRDPDFIECVEYRLEHDEIKRTPGPQGMTVGPTNAQVAESRCLDDLFPVD